MCWQTLLLLRSFLIFFRLFALLDEEQWIGRKEKKNRPIKTDRVKRRKVFIWVNDNSSIIVDAHAHRLKSLLRVECAVGTHLFIDVFRHQLLWFDWKISFRSLCFTNCASFLYFSSLCVNHLLFLLNGSEARLNPNTAAHGNRYSCVTSTNLQVHWNNSQDKMKTFIKCESGDDASLLYSHWHLHHKECV